MSAIDCAYIVRLTSYQGNPPHPEIEKLGRSDAADAVEFAVKATGAVIWFSLFFGAMVFHEVTHFGSRR